MSPPVPVHFVDGYKSVDWKNGRIQLNPCRIGADGECERVADVYLSLPAARELFNLLTFALEDAEREAGADVIALETAKR